jgi:hypothetical protein
MDTNIENYSPDEIIKIIKVGDNYDLETLFSKTEKIINDIENSDAENSNELTKFFRDCFNKVTKSLDYVVPEYMLINLGLKSPNREISGTSTSVKIYTEANKKYQKLVEERNYPYSVPEMIPNNVAINTTTTKYPRGNVNPIKRETIKHLLTVNSKFRENYNEMTTDFSVNLREPFNNVISIKLASIEFLNSYYSFSIWLKTNKFTVTTYLYDLTTLAKSNINTILVEFPEGNYNVTTLQATLNGIFNATPSLQIVQVNYIASKGKLYWQLNPGAPLPPAGFGHAFDLDFISGVNNELYKNFGWLVGFRQAKYTFLEDYKQPPPTITFFEGFNPEAFINFNGTQFYLLEVCDYNKNTSEVLKYELAPKYSFNIRDIIAKLPNVATQEDLIFEDSSDRIFKKRNYFGPVRLKKLRFRLLNENGTVVNH